MNDLLTTLTAEGMELDRTRFFLDTGIYCASVSDVRGYARKSVAELLALLLAEHEARVQAESTHDTDSCTYFKKRAERAEAENAKLRRYLTAGRDEWKLNVKALEQAEAKVGRLKAETKLMQQFWMTAMMAVRFYHELGDEFDCKAAMASLAEAAEEDEAADLERRWTERTRP